MARVAVCIFFTAILHTGIITSLQANETLADDVPKNDKETIRKPTEVESVKESQVASIVETEDSNRVSSESEPKGEEVRDVTEEKDGTPTEEKEAKPKESKKEDVTEKTTTGDNKKLLPNMLKGTPVEQTSVFFEFPKNILRPVNEVGAKIGEAFFKGIDTAKDLADGTYTFFRTSAKNLFE